MEGAGPMGEESDATVATDEGTNGRTMAGTIVEVDLGVCMAVASM